MSEAIDLCLPDASIAVSTANLPEWYIEVIFEQERDSLETVLDALRSGDVFYDIGANYGLYSVFAAQEIDDCQVVAVEPYPPNVNALHETIKLNDVSDITVCGVALGDNDESRLFEPPDSQNYATATFQQDDSAEDTIDVETRRGDTLIERRNLPKPNVVKIDVEGAEPEVLTGMREALGWQQCRYLLCELHPPDPEAAHLQSLADYDSSVDDVLNQITTLGFEPALQTREEQHHVVAHK